MTASLFPWPWKTPPPGIYFNMPFDEYLEIPCMNAGGTKKILTSPTDFYCASWMYPLREDFTTDKKHYADGRAYHCRILEGKKVFYSQYAPEYEDDITDRSIIRDAVDLKRALKLAECKTGFATKLEGSMRLLEKKPHARILDIVKQQHKEKFGPDKEYLKPKTIRYIEICAKMIEHHPDLKTYFAGGYPEVTVIWDDPLYGLRFKIRIDYQKICGPCDLKSFNNNKGKRIDRAIEDAIASYKYHIQGGLYLRGVSFAKNFAANSMVFGADNVDPEWLKAFSTTPATSFRYIFAQKGAAPVSRGSSWSVQDKPFIEATHEILTTASNLFKDNYKTFGEDPWIDLSKPKQLSFSSMPSYINDI